MSKVNKLGALFIQMTLIAIIACVLMVTFFVSLPRVETQYWPVVEKLQILRVEPTADGRSIVYAKFNKIRQCDYIGISWFERDTDGTLARVPVEILRSAGDVSSPNRPTGTQIAGPWIVGISPDKILQVSNVRLMHQCHPFWLTVTGFYP